MLKKFFAHLGVNGSDSKVQVVPRANSVLTQLVVETLFDLPSDMSSAESFSVNTDRTRDVLASVDTPETMNKIIAIAKPFVEKIGAAKANITAMKADVTAMKTQIDATTEKILADDPMMARHLKLTGSAQNLRMMPWDQLKYFGSERKIVGNLNADVTKEPTDSLSPSWLAMYVAKLPMVCKSDTLTDIKLEDTVRAKMVEVLVGSTKASGLTESDVNQAMDLLTQSGRGTFRLTAMITNTVHATEMLDRAMENLSTIRTLAPVMTAIDKGAVEMSKTTLEAFRKNIGIVSQYMLASAYQICMLRRDTYANAYLLPNKTVNPDVTPKFPEGTSIEQLVSHYVDYLGIPPRGVTAEQLLASKESLDVKYAKDVESVTLSLKAKQTTTVAAAATQVFMTYARDYATKNSLVGHEQMAKFAQAHAVECARSNKPMEDSIYGFIMALKHSGTLTEQLWMSLNAAYTERLSQTKTFTERDRDLAEANVIAQMTSKFLVNNFVTIKR
jgi:hypothetical protein